jgi:4-hydroxy-2-oxoheptanedioate aldolase
MILNLWKEKLQKQALFGSFVTFASPGITEFTASLGFDFLVLDNEHAAMDNVVIEDMIRASQCVGVPAVVRVPYNRPEYIRKALDSGANGVQVPLIASSKDVLDVISPANFPSLGDRGVAYLTRSAGYGQCPDKAAYLKRANENKLISVHIETVEAVRNIEDILSVGGVDVYFIGPGDLSASMGYAHDPNHPDVWKTVEQCIRTIRNKGKIAGTYAGDVARSKQVIEWGATYILTAVTPYMVQGATKYLKELRG